MEPRYKRSKGSPFWINKRDVHDQCNFFHFTESTVAWVPHRRRKIATALISDNNSNTKCCFLCILANLTNLKNLHQYTNFQAPPIHSSTVAKLISWASKIVIVWLFLP